MNANGSLAEIFNKLVELYRQGNFSDGEQLIDRLKKSRKKIRIEVEEDIQWEPCYSSEFEECPTVTQTFQVYVGGKLAYEGERVFGSELEDPTHTGLGSEWATIRVDDGEERAIFEVLGRFGQEIDWPEAPPWR